MRKYYVIIFILCVFYFFSVNHNTGNKHKKSLLTESKVSLLINNRNISLLENDYFLGVLACEMPASFEIEALKANLLAIRTFYYYNKKNDNIYIANTKEQCYIDELDMKIKWGNSFDNYYKKLKDIVNTTDEVIIYNDSLIKSYYYSTSNGYTEDSYNVFGIKYDYLKSVESLVDKNVKKFESSTAISFKYIIDMLSLKNDQINIKITDRDSNNRVKYLLINDKTYTGVELRKLLSLRSTDFDFVINEDSIIFTTRGYGHGVGLSQYGANEMAKLGYSYKDIIKHYYTGVDIVKY